MKIIVALLALCIGVGPVMATAPQTTISPYSWNEDRGTNTDGTVTHVLADHWRNYTDVAGWYPISLSLVQTGMGFYLQDAPYALHLPVYADEMARFVSTNKYDVGNRVMRNDAPISMVKQFTGAAHVMGTLSGNSVIYPRALPIGDIIYRFTDENFQSLVRMNSEPAGTGDLVIPFTEKFSNGLAPQFKKHSIGMLDENVGNGYEVDLNDFRGIRTLPATVWDSGIILQKSQIIEIKGHFSGSVFYGEKIIPRSFLDGATYPIFTDTTTTFTPVSGANSPMDGECLGEDPTWSTARGLNPGTSCNVTNTTFRVMSQNVGGTSDVLRSYFLFNTSSLGAGATITSATLGLWPTSLTNQDADSISIITTTPASNSTLATSDYQNVGTIKQATDIALSSLTTGVINTWTLNATGISNISLTSITKFGARTAKEIANTTPGTGNQNFVNFASMDAGVTAEDPILTVVTSGGAATVVARHRMFFY